MARPSVLKADTRIGNYSIVEVVDINSHSVVYRARVGDTDELVWVQEYMPRDLAGRQQDGDTVRPRRGKMDAFEEGLSLFLREARVLSQIHDPYVARVREYTESGGTAFIVMDQEVGTTLKEHLDQHGKLGQEELRALSVPLLKGLRIIHSHGLLHRDINPGNIFLRNSGPPLLLGFGRTHHALSAGEAGLESRVTPGYSAIEQYHDQGNLGPWTDLYAIGATLYHCISGSTPVAANERVAAIAEGGPDPLTSAMQTGKGRYDAGLLSNIDYMLQPEIENRPQSAGEILTRFSEFADSGREASGETIPGEEAQEITSHAAQTELKLRTPKLYADPKTRAPLKQVPSGSNPLFWIISVGLLVGVGIFTFWPQIKSLTSTQQQDVVQAPTHIEGTKIPEDILEQPLPDETPPELPESLEFTRKADDFRADTYRKISQQDHGVRTLLQSAQARMERGDLIGPSTENALANYRAILALDADNLDAAQGIEEITDMLMQRAKDQLKGDELEFAGETLQTMREAGIATKVGIALQQQIAELIQLKNAEVDQIKQKSLAEQEQLEKQKQAEQERIKQQKLAAEERIQQEKTAELERIRLENLAEQERIKLQKLAVEEHIRQQEIDELERVKKELVLKEKQIEQERIRQQKLAEEKERIQQEKTAELERIRLDKLTEQERIKQQKLAAEERIRQQNIAELERVKKELVLKERQIEQERIRQQKLAEEERIRQQNIAEQEHIRLEKLAEQERIKQEESKKRVSDANRINSLLAQAESSTTQGGLTRSSAASGLGHYREVLGIDPDNEKAKAGILKIVRFYIDAANRALAVDLFDVAENNLILADAIDPDNDAVDLLHDQMELRKNALAKAKPQTQKKEVVKKPEQKKVVEQSGKVDPQQIKKGVDAYYLGRYVAALDILKPLA
jgi:serine/threonine protein kinase